MAARKRRRRLVTTLGGVLVAFLGALAWQVVDVLTSATLIGRVADLEGRPVMGAVVEVEGSEFRVTSDEEGCFGLDAVPGDHWLLIQLPGESGVAIPVSLSGGARKDVGAVYLFRR